MNIFTNEEHFQWALRSWNAEKEHKEIELITNSYPDFQRPEGYQIQNVRTEIIENEGYKVVGYKLGSTSMRKRMQMGSTTSSYGRLFDYMQIRPGEPLLIDELIHPKAEPEVTFFFKEDLIGPFVTPAEVLKATDYVTASIEIIDSRYIDFKFKGPDVVADNISGGKFILSDKKVDPSEIDLELIGVNVILNGKSVGQGAACEVMGNPARAITDFLKVFYTNTQKGIKAGDFVMTGGITQSFTLKRGDEISARFSGLGDVGFTVK